MNKKLSADEIADLASKGKDVTGYMKNMKIGFNADRIEKIRRTSLDLGPDLMEEIDTISNELNVSRQALIKVVMKEYIIRYKLAKSA
jgi:hypothetical protein